jgi:hypothetical protein
VAEGATYQAFFKIALCAPTLAQYDNSQLIHLQTPVVVLSVKELDNRIALDNI